MIEFESAGLYTSPTGQYGQNQFHIRAVVMGARGAKKGSVVRQGPFSVSSRCRTCHLADQGPFVFPHGLDRQACGGTHLSNTGQSTPFRIGKIENKGKRNRRIRSRLEL